LTRTQAARFDQNDALQVLENVKEMWTEAPRTGKGKGRAKPINKVCPPPGAARRGALLLRRRACRLGWRGPAGEGLCKYHRGVGPPSGSRVQPRTAPAAPA